MLSLLYKENIISRKSSLKERKISVYSIYIRNNTLYRINTGQRLKKKECLLYIGKELV